MDVVWILIGGVLSLHGLGVAFLCPLDCADNVEDEVFFLVTLVHLIFVACEEFSQPPFPIVVTALQ